MVKQRWLYGAKTDFRDVKKYVRRQFGELVLADVNKEFKDTIKRIAQLIVHMFVRTKRDFKTHLERRLLSPI